MRPWRFSVTSVPSVRARGFRGLLSRAGILLVLAAAACGRGRDPAAGAAARDTAEQTQAAADSQPDPPCLASRVGLPCQ